MIIQIASDIWKIHGLFHLLGFITQKGFEEVALKDYGIVIDPAFIKHVEQLEEALHEDKEILSLFFHPDLAGLNIFYSDLDFLKCIPSLDSLVPFDGYCSKEALEELFLIRISQLLGLTNKQFQRIKKNSDLVLPYLEIAELSEDLKWRLFLFIKNTGHYIELLEELLEKALPTYLLILASEEKKVENFIKCLQIEISEDESNFTERLLRYFQVESANQIFILPSLLNQEAFAYTSPQGNIYLKIGQDYQTVLDSIIGVTKEEKLIQSLSALADITRLNILFFIKSEEKFGREINEALGIKKAALSYHMDLLQASGLIKVQKKGTRFYYSLNKEKIHDMFQLIMNHLSIPIGMDSIRGGL